eukprot:2806162-Rhodomonas_salina.1
MEKAYYLGQKAAESASAASTPEKEKREKGQPTLGGMSKACPLLLFFIHSGRTLGGDQTCASLGLRTLAAGGLYLIQQP